MTDQKSYAIERDKATKMYAPISALDSDRTKSALHAIRGHFSYGYDACNARSAKLIEEKDSHIREAASAYADHLSTLQSQLAAAEGMIENLRAQLLTAKREGYDAAVKQLESGDAVRVYAMDLLQKPQDWADWLEKRRDEVLK